MANQRKQ